MANSIPLPPDADDPRRPQFRRGWSPEIAGCYLPVHYRAVTTARADQAWRQLVRADWVVKRAPGIASAMGAGRETSAKCRRVFHALGLIQNTPGAYNLDAIDDWESNVPAVVLLRTRDPEAFTQATAHYSDALFYVASREAPGPLVEDWTDPSSLRSSGWERQSRPGTVWMARDGHLDALPRFLIEPNGSPSGGQANYSPSKCSPDREPYGAWFKCGPPPLVILAKDDRAQLGAKRRAPTGHLLAIQGTNGIGPKDVREEFGCSVATAKRILDRWIEAGQCRRIARGKYFLIGRIK